MDPNEFDKLNLNLNESESSSQTTKDQTLISPSFDQVEKFVSHAAKTTNFKKGDCYYN